MQKLYTNINERIDRLDGEACIIFKNLQTGETIFENSEELFPAASMIKLLILFELYIEYENGEIDLDEKIKISEQRDTSVLNMGVVHLLSDDVKLTYRDLALLMIVHSDNIATNTLMDKLTIEKINATAKKFGIEHTLLKRKMNAGMAHMTMGKEMLIIFENIIESELLSQDSRKEIFQLLAQQRCNSKIPWYISRTLDNPYMFAHKTGEIIGCENDGGIFYNYNNNEKYVLIILTKNLKENIEGVEFNQKVGREVYKYIMNQ